MDSSSSIGFPLSGNPQSPENSPPPHSSTAGIHGSANPHSTESLPPQHSSSVSVEIPQSENPQSTDTPPNQQIYCNGPPSLVVSNADWNEELSNCFNDRNFFIFMRGGACHEPYLHWYGCMHRAIYIGGDKANCSNLAGIVRDCIFANVDYHQSFLTHLSETHQ